ncbi:MAG TPA: hypothetical protein VF763_00845 [Candidatus Limnocylindrales bacterium]
MTRRSGHRAGASAGLRLLVSAVLLAAAISVLSAKPPAVRAAGPSPSPAVGDTRSSGEGAGAAGAPLGALQAVLVVVGLGLATTGLTVLYVRLTDGSRRP